MFWRSPTRTLPQQKQEADPAHRRKPENATNVKYSDGTRTRVLIRSSSGDIALSEPDRALLLKAPLTLCSPHHQAIGNDAPFLFLT
jgi:hypothetical protein